MQLIVSRATAPQLVNAFAQNASPDKISRGSFILEPDDTKWRLRLYEKVSTEGTKDAKMTEALHSRGASWIETYILGVEKKLNINISKASKSFDLRLPEAFMNLHLADKIFHSSGQTEV